MFGIRTVDSKRKSNCGRFQYQPVGEITKAPDWKRSKQCGNGLHFLKDGKGDWSLMALDKVDNICQSVKTIGRTVDIDGQKRKAEGLLVEREGNMSVWTEQLQKK